MKKLLLIALLLSAGTAFGTAYTANTTGPWNVAATWSGAGVPGAGDTAKINNAVTVTCPVSVTCSVGLAAADNTTEALGCTDATATGTGNLVVNGTFIYSGVINQCNGTWTWGAGATITHDSSAHPAQHYPWNVGVNNATAALIDASAGTSGSHITVNKTSTSGFSGGFPCGSAGCIDGGLIKATWLDFQDCGGPAVPCSKHYGNAAGEGLLFSHVTCSLAGHGCGQMLIENVCATCNFAATDTLWTVPNVASGVCAWALDGAGNGISTTFTSGSRDFSRTVIAGGYSVFSSTVARGSAIHLTLSSTIFESTTGASDCAPYVANRSYTVDTCTNVIIYNAIAAAGSPAETPGGTNCTRMIYLRTGNTTNAHFIDAIVAATTVDGFIAQLEGDQGAGASNADLFQTQVVAGGSNFAVTFKHGLSLPDGGGHALGTFTNHSDATTCTANGCPLFTCENNTFGGTDSATLAIGCAGENSVAVAGMEASNRNNLVYFGLTGTAFNAGTCWETKWQTSATPVANTYTLADHNGFINCTAGIANRYFRSVIDPTEYNATPGTGDVSVATNPLVDPSRNFQKWAQTINPSDTTFALAIADINAGTITLTQLFASNVGAYDWIRAGWAPKGAAGLSLRGAGYDGSDLGAVPWVAGGCGFTMLLGGVGCN